jgi:hypothetical protein
MTDAQNFRRLEPADPQIDSVAFALANVLKELIWIKSHLYGVVPLRGTDLETAEQDIREADHCAASALEHGRYLRKLLLDGKQINRSKRLPDDFEQM